MREFYLRNALGQEWNLNNSASFFHTVKGLGQEHKVTYTQVGTQYIKTKDALSQKSITGKIRFAGYDDYRAYSMFIQHKPLTLIYGREQAEDSGYCLDISVDTLEKTELETGGLQSKVTFKSLGTYYRQIKASGVLDADTGTATIAISSDTVLLSGIRLCIAGACVNPRYTHYLNGVAVCTGRFQCEIEEGSVMVIDTSVLPYMVNEAADGEIVRDLYGASDFSTKRFLLLGYGENVIEFQHEGEGELDVTAEAKLEYESV